MDRYTAQKYKSKTCENTKKTKKTTKKTTKTAKTTKTKKTTKGSGYIETKAKWDEKNMIKHQNRLNKRYESKTRHSEALKERNQRRHQVRIQRRENTDAKVARINELTRAKRDQFFKNLTAFRQGQMSGRQLMTRSYPVNTR